jgi:hypothetical protein
MPPWPWYMSRVCTSVCFSAKTHIQ